MDEDGAPLGMIFGGNSNFSYAFKFANIFDADKPYKDYFSKFNFQTMKLSRLLLAIPMTAILSSGVLGQTINIGVNASGKLLLRWMVKYQNRYHSSTNSN